MHPAVTLQEYKEHTGAFLSIGLMINFLSLNDMLRISLHGKPIFGVNLNTYITNSNTHLLSTIYTLLFISALVYRKSIHNKC